jgi:hypothetical protein
MEPSGLEYVTNGARKVGRLPAATPPPVNTGASRFRVNAQVEEAV